MIDRNLFKNPPRSLGISPMCHHVGEDIEGLLAYADRCRHAGAVINVPFGSGFTSSQPEKTIPAFSPPKTERNTAKR